MQSMVDDTVQRYLAQAGLANRVATAEERIAQVEGTSAESAAIAEAAAAMAEALRQRMMMRRSFGISPSAQGISIRLPASPVLRRASLAIAAAPAELNPGSISRPFTVYGPALPPSSPAPAAASGSTSREVHGAATPAGATPQSASIAPGASTSSDRDADVPMADVQAAESSALSSHESERTAAAAVPGPHAPSLPADLAAAGAADADVQMEDLASGPVQQ